MLFMIIERFQERRRQAVNRAPERGTRSPASGYEPPADPSRPGADPLGARRRGHRRRHADAAVRREPAARHLVELRGSLQLRPADARTFSARRPVRPSVADAVRRGPGARRFPVGAPRRRLVADVGARHVRRGDRLGPRGQARVDVRRRPVHRLRHAPGGRLHERPRHLRPVELRAAVLPQHARLSWPAASSRRSSSTACVRADAMR